ncbi:hypothetical protein BDN70DRAFT_938955 [Pholiota conissans]|uniref:Uncharacterized protein n=1 Tax=Pholiota conissans TaxID=109636 RepID=A0A9P5YLD0_9AGAR|nr:hypothetical protein BDN70DRAFT_938955 [Pholiota conissans]
MSFPESGADTDYYADASDADLPQPANRTNNDSDAGFSNIDADYVASDAGSEFYSSKIDSSESEYSVVNADGEREDPVIPSEHALSFFQRDEHYTVHRVFGRKRKVSKRSGGRGQYSNEARPLYRSVHTIKTTRIKTTKNPPKAMRLSNKRQKTSPISRPFSAEALENGTAHRFRTVRRGGPRDTAAPVHRNNAVAQVPQSAVAQVPQDAVAQVPRNAVAIRPSNAIVPARLNAPVVPTGFNAPFVQNAVLNAAGIRSQAATMALPIIVINRPQIFIAAPQPAVEAHQQPAATTRRWRPVQQNAVAGPSRGRGTRDDPYILNDAWGTQNDSVVVSDDDPDYTKTMASMLAGYSSGSDTAFSSASYEPSSSSSSEDSAEDSDSD